MMQSQFFCYLNNFW